MPRCVTIACTRTIVAMDMSATVDTSANQDAVSTTLTAQDAAVPVEVWPGFGGQFHGSS